MRINQNALKYIAVFIVAIAVGLLGFAVVKDDIRHFKHSDVSVTFGFKAVQRNSESIDYEKIVSDLKNKGVESNLKTKGMTWIVCCVLSGILALIGGIGALAKSKRLLVCGLIIVACIVLAWGCFVMYKFGDQVPVDIGKPSEVEDVKRIKPDFGVSIIIAAIDVIVLLISAILLFFTNKKDD